MKHLIPYLQDDRKAADYLRQLRWPTGVTCPRCGGDAVERRLGIIMNGVTGRMGTNQHLVRSINAIRAQGGEAIAIVQGGLQRQQRTQCQQQRRKHGFHAGTAGNESGLRPAHSPAARNASNSVSGIAFAIRNPCAWSQPALASHASAPGSSTPSAVTR